MTGVDAARARSAIVVGGGIGGMAVARALALGGWQVTVLEQAAVFWEAGAGLLVTPNGVRALGALGLLDDVLAEGHRVRLAGIRDAADRPVTRLPSGRDAHVGVGVHRRALHGVLTEGATAAGANLVPGARVVSIQPGSAGGPPGVVAWQDAEGDHTASANLVVGADGAHSLARAIVAPGSPTRASGYTSWRAVVTDEDVLGDDALVWWGPGAEFAAQRISASRVSWQATFRHPEGVGFTDDLVEAREMFAGWCDTVRSLITRTGADELVRHDLYAAEDGLRSYVSGRTVLLGDAAHPVLPALAQGANLALEDAAVLGHVLGGGGRLRRGLAAYDAQRRPRADVVAERSRRALALGVDSRLGFGLRALPDAWVARWYDSVYAWVAPA